MASKKKPRLQPGDVVGERYRIDGIVGRGGFGAVYRAAHVDTGAVVALKVLLKNFNSSQVDGKRFAREASLVQKLRHPNVVQLLDFGTTEEGMSYIAFELLVGKALSKVLKTAGALPLYRAAQIARDILSALAAAHAMGIIHRDVKPGNVFLCEGSEEAKVLDFGIAKAVTGEEAAATQLTEAGQMIGTPHYMAPEQVRGTGVTAATDVYAAGLLLAEMIAGERIVKGNALIDVYMTHISDDPVPLPEAVLESPIGEMIQKAVQKDLSLRFGTAAEMIAELDRLMPGLNKSPLRAAGTDPSRERVRKVSGHSLEALSSMPSASIEPPSSGDDDKDDAATQLMDRDAVRKQQERLEAVVSSHAPGPSTNNPSTPSTGQPSTGQPSAGQPSTGQPSTGQPSTGRPKFTSVDATIGLEGQMSPLAKGTLPVSALTPAPARTEQMGPEEIAALSSGQPPIPSSNPMSSGAPPSSGEGLSSGPVPSGPVTSGPLTSGAPSLVPVQPAAKGPNMALVLIVVAAIALIAAAVIMLAP